MSKKYHVEIITHLLYLMMDLFIVGEVMELDNLDLGHNNESEYSSIIINLRMSNKYFVDISHTLALLDDGSV